jgi:tetratricopeptide (TPR) repeat protein
MSRSARLPYPGLRPFLRDESDLFFGREGCVDDMVARLKATRFLAVLGASGSGKSSMVATGLLDALELGLLAPAGSRWQVAQFRPGGEPIRKLAAALVGPGGEQPTGTGAGVHQEIELLASFLRRGPHSVAQWCLDGNLPRGCNLLILVDQFEELFRYGNYASREEAEAFVSLLIASVQTDDVPIHVVITLRSEYVGACALIPGLVERINAGLYLTPRMTRDQVREAIEGPARVCGFAIEPALVNRLLNDLSSFAPWEDDPSDDELLSRQSDQLPLMQHVLNRLWLRANQAADGRPVQLWLREYEQFGGLRGALDAHAREVFESVPDSDRPIVEIVFRALVSGTSVANAVRRPCRYRELVDLAQGDRAAVDRVVQAFRAADCNFLTPPAGVALDDWTVVDISHESLIRQWSVLSDWLDKEVRAAAFWRRLVAAAESFDRGEGDLLRGADLAYFVALWTRENPTATECQCNIAWNYRSIGSSEKERGNFDAAVVSYQRALLIYDDLQRLEPNRAWSPKVAGVASDLARVLGNRGEWQSALMYAEVAAHINRVDAERHSADSDTRIEYAGSLELVAQFARAVGNLNKQSDPKLAESYFKKAVASLVDANEIHESVLVVDPNKGVCRCQVGSNYMTLANIYENWGKTAELREANNRAVQVYRELLEKQPDSGWQYKLAHSLFTRANKESKDSHEAVLTDYREASTLLRALQRDPDREASPDSKEMLVSSLGYISFNALFVGRDAEALAAAEEALQLSPGELWIVTNKAHALMYLGRTDEALRIYLEHKGKPLSSKTWDEVIAADFAELKAAGRAHPLMDRVRAAIGTPHRAP